jgi:DnaD/phage-associated family protein
MMGDSPNEQQAHLLQALNEACESGVLLKASIPMEKSKEILYFVNSLRGQKAVEAIQNGNFNYNPDKSSTFQLTAPRPNVFRLYEENIGPLTPIIADTLTELENEYSADWIAEAFQEALKSNVRNLRYIEAILKNWQEAGKNVRTNRRSSQKSSEEHDPDEYVGGEYSEFIDH